MTIRASFFVAMALGAAMSAPAGATDRAQASEAVSKSATATASPAAPPAETIGAAVYRGRDLVWSGSLRVGGPYGSASFSQSKSEYGAACPGEEAAGRYATSSESLSFSLGRYNWQQELDRFSVNLNWSSPVASCQGEGNNTFGFSRMVTVPRGQTVTVEGVGGMSVRLTRPQ